MFIALLNLNSPFRVEFSFDLPKHQDPEGGTRGEHNIGGRLKGLKWNELQECVRNERPETITFKDTV